MSDTITTQHREIAESRPAVAERLDCGVFSAALPRTLTPRRSQSGDQSPHSRRFAHFTPTSGLAGAKHRETAAGIAVAPASWTAPALWRFSHAGWKAAEGCRTPKPVGVSGVLFSTGGARGCSPQRQPWAVVLDLTNFVRSDRTVRREKAFLPPLRGLRILNIEPTACAVGYPLPPRCGCETVLARRWN